MPSPPTRHFDLGQGEPAGQWHSDTLFWHSNTKPPCFGRWPEAGGRVGGTVSGSDGYPVLPRAPGRFRLPYGAAPGPFARDAPREAGQDPLDGSGDLGALCEEPGLGLLADEAQAVADVGAPGRPVVTVGEIVVAIVVAAVRARAGEGDANEGGVELLADAALGLGVEGLDPERPGRVPFLHAPMSRIEIGVRRDGIPAVVKQGGREAGFRVGVPVSDEPDAQGPRAQRGLVLGPVNALCGGICGRIRIPGS